MDKAKMEQIAPETSAIEIRTSRNPATRVTRFLRIVETIGNRLPDPATILLVCAVGVLVVSAWAAQSGWSATDPVSGRTIHAVNLLSVKQLPSLFINMLGNFQRFPIMAIGVAVFLGVGVAQRSGFLETFVGSLLRFVSARWLTPVVMFACICLKVATIEGALFLIPLAGALYAAAGRNPLVGIATAFAGLGGALCANVLIAPMDANFFGLTQIGARIIDPHWNANIAGNYYIMATWALILTALGSWITEAIIAPRLEAARLQAATDLPALTPTQKRGLLIAVPVLFACFVVLAAITIPSQGLMRDATGSLAPFYKSMVPFVLLIGLTIGTAYGVGAGTVRSYRDVVRFAGESVSELGPYLVVCFVAAQFVAWFSESNLGTLISVGTAHVLMTAHLPGWAILIGVILFSFGLELLIVSANVKWAILAPVIVPMLMLMHISPEAATAAFRIGDSAGSIITPLNALLPLVLAFGRRYDPGFGLGSLIALMLPYAFFFLVSGIVLLMLWNGLQFPLGPDGAKIPYPG